MNVCRRCGELSGIFVDPHDDRVERVQKCSCRHDTLNPASRVIWPTYEFNLAVELCFCCVGEVVRTGLHASPFFCAVCLPWIRSFNDSFGAVVVPICRQQAMGADSKDIKRSGVQSKTGLLGAVTRMKGHRRQLAEDVLQTHFAKAFDVKTGEFLDALKDIARFHRFTKLSQGFADER